MNENWEVNLLVGDGDVEGYNKFSLVYVATTQEKYKLDQNVGTITGQQPIVLEHVGDVEAPVPARLVEANKLGNWRLSVYDDENTPPSWDSIFNNTSILTRHFSGATSTAARHTVNGTAQEVRVQIIPEGATNSTYYTVQSGYADTSRSYWTPESQQSDGTTSQRGVWFIPINFTFDDAGKGEPFTLRNDLPSSPHFIEDSNSDGLADGWTLTGTPATSIETTNYLAGGKAQAFQAPASATDSGINSFVSLSGGEDIVAYVWINFGSGSDDVSVILQESGATPNIIQEKRLQRSDPMAIADKSIINILGLTWYRVVVSGTANGSANGVQLRVRRKSTYGATLTVFNVDNAYLQTGTLIAPDGWCSSSSLKNRYDPTSTSAATRQQINYLDVWGIPGDLPATFDYSLDGGGTGTAESGFVMSALSDGENLVTDWLHLIDSADSILSSTGTTTADASRIDGSYERFSAPGTLATLDPLGGIGTTGFGDWLAKVPARVYAIARTSNLLHTLKLSWDLPGTGQNDIAEFDTVNKWELLDLGLLNVSSDAERAIVMFDIDVDITFGTVDIDALVFLPAQDEKLVIVPTSEEILLSPFFSSFGNDEYITHIRSINSQTYAPKITYAGGLWKVHPGNITNRLVLTTVGSFSNSNEQEIDIAATTDVSLTVTPSTSHLLGTA